MPFSTEALLHALPSALPVRRYLVAFSGGLDSLVLLHALTTLRDRLTAPELQAIHVNHGLSANAVHWCEHCVQQCAELGVALSLRSVDAKPLAGESPEAAARNARYAVLREMVREGDCLLTAHHQDDQAETLLLQLLRGAGPKGLAAMPAMNGFAAGWHVRPLLGFRREQLQAYARQHGLDWIDDESNFDTGFDRNFLRHEILPQLTQRFPGLASTLSRSAVLCAEAAELLADTARADAQSVSVSDDRLSVQGLRELGEVRARNLLHWWVGERGLPVPSAAQLQNIWREGVCAAPDATPLIRWQGGEVRRYRDALYVMPPLAPYMATGEWCWDMRQPLVIAGVGSLSAVPQAGQALSLAALEGKQLIVRFRRGGERLRLPGREGHHDVKKLFQEAGVPPWQRQRTPLLFCGDDLAAVVGHWVAAEYQAGPEEPAVNLQLETNAEVI